MKSINYAQYARDVIEASHERPVIVDIWDPS